MRTIVGLIVGPAVGILVCGLYGFAPLIIGLSLSSALRGLLLTLFLLVPAYVLTVLLGTPILLLVRRLAGLSWHKSIASMMVVVLIEGILLIIFSRPSADDFITLDLIAAAVLGAIACGTTFWFIERKEIAR